MELFDAINLVLQRHGINCRASEHNLTVTDNGVTDVVHDEHEISNAIINAIWPSIPDIEVFHYTTRDAAESILRAHEWRLYALSKRFSEGEIVDFSKAHHLQGFLEPDANGDPVYKSLNMANMFYSSFTRTDLRADKEAYFWGIFAGNQGVRLRIRLSATNPNLRRVYYPAAANDPIPVLIDLQNCVETFGKRFTLAGISRLCAFYLHSGFAIEEEVRMLYRKWPGIGPPVSTDGTHEYISLHLEQPSDMGFRISVVEIQTDEPAQFTPFGLSIISRSVGSSP